MFKINYAIMDTEYGEWKKEKVAFEEFSSEVIKTADSFLRTIYSINPTLRKEFSLKTIEENLLYLKKENEREI